MRARAIALILTVVSIPALTAQTGDGVTAGSLLIGIEDRTGSFPVDEENLGMRVVVQETNDTGGIHGRQLVPRGYTRAPDGSAAEVANARRLMTEDRVFLIFGHGGPAAPDIAPLAMANHVPYLFPHTALVTRDADRYVFTSYPPYLGECQVMYRFLAQTRGYTRIGVIYADNAYGRFFRERLDEYAGRYGYTVTGAVAVNERTPADLTEAVTTIRGGGPAAVILALYPEQAQRVMEAKARLNWSNVHMVATGPLTDEQYLNVGGGAAEGTLGFGYYPDPNASDEPGVAEYRRVMAKYAPGHALNRYSLYGFVFGRLIVEGLKRAGASLTRERFIDAMETIRDWPSGGILPPVTLSKTSHHAQRAGFICELTDGHFRPLTGWIEP